MAESADILASENQKVLLPHLHAGCPMADMATVGAVSQAYKELLSVGIMANRKGYGTGDLCELIRCNQGPLSESGKVLSALRPTVKGC